MAEESTRLLLSEMLPTGGYTVVMETLSDVAGEMLPLVVIIFVIVPGMDAAWNKLKEIW